MADRFVLPPVPTPWLRFGVAEWLRDTRAYLAAHGWSRRVTGDKRRCLFMAMQETCRRDEDWTRLVTSATIALKQAIGDGVLSIVAWNDEQSSIEPVLDLLDRTIEGLEHG